MRDGHVVEDFLSLENPAMAVRGVFAEADVRDNDQIRHLALEGPDGVLDRRVGIRCFRAVASLLSGRPKRSTPRTPSAFAAAASLTASSTDSW